MSTSGPAGPDPSRTPGAGPGRRAFLHVGLQKTGTSFLQSLLWGSPEELARQGARMVPGTRAGTFRLMRRLRAGSGPQVRRVLRSLRQEVADTAEPVLVLSQETLAGVGPERAAALRDCFAGCELHLIVTARDLARQLPSMWQQKAKGQHPLGYEQYLEAVARGRGAGRRFWEQQDLVAVLEAWRGDLPAEQVHVVTVPPPGADPDTLVERFGGLLGIDLGALSAAEVRRNVSLDPVQVELVRQVSARLDLPRRRHARVVKQLLAAQVLAPRRGEPPRAPVAWEPRCREEAARQTAYLRDTGVDVVGDVADLESRPEAFSADPPQVTGEALRAVGVQAIADLLVREAAARDLGRDPGGGSSAG